MNKTIILSVFAVLSISFVVFAMMNVAVMPLQSASAIKPLSHPIHPDPLHIIHIL
jgi:hypothetical protein